MQEETGAKRWLPTGNWRAWQMKESVGVCRGVLKVTLILNTVIFMPHHHEGNSCRVRNDDTYLKQTN